MTRRMWVWSLAGLCSLLMVAAVTAQEKKPSDEPKKPDVPKKAEEAKKPEAPKSDKPAAGKPDDAKMAELTKKWVEYATPGEAHKRLDALVGKWAYENRWWMGPADEPQVFPGTSELKWIFDGRYLQQEATGPAADPNGPPFRGSGLYGYDNAKKQYFCTWFDNMGTGIMVGWGTCDAVGKVITYTGEYADPMTGDLHKKFRSVLKLESPDKFVYECYTSGPDGKEFKEMELTYTRAK